MESCVNSLAYYCCCSLFGFGVKHMNAARHFRRYFSPKRLENIYSDKIKYRATVGMDRIAPKAFEDKLDENVQLISQKVLSGKYKFTRYREVLISKGRRKEPRVISIPTIRDKLALSAYHQFLQSSFGETVQEPLLHTIVGDITQEVLSGHFDGYVKIDITHFYASIDHRGLNMIFKTFLEFAKKCLRYHSSNLMLLFQ